MLGFVVLPERVLLTVFSCFSATLFRAVSGDGEVGVAVTFSACVWAVKTAEGVVVSRRRKAGRLSLVSACCRGITIGALDAVDAGAAWVDKSSNVAGGVGRPSLNLTLSVSIASALMLADSDASLGGSWTGSPATAGS
ncbi:hypothetical protein IWX90DRAFT_421077 [Phyllosticta citrichinensis]|uniref:Secreted protein n=1 Tax=Phyllosticta citrichinensis TaxID=1130410 RepID=A0ABR1Y7B8_9PEZI